MLTTHENATVYWSVKLIVKTIVHKSLLGEVLSLEKTEHENSMKKHSLQQKCLLVEKDLMALLFRNEKNYIEDMAG